MSIAETERYFWSSVQGVSMWDEVLATAKGQVFLAKCKAEGKSVCAWTVNTKEGMRNCIQWGLESCITDKPYFWNEVIEEVS